MTNEVTALPDTKDIIPRDYQIEAYHACADVIRHYKGPFYVEASVGAGKTVMMAMILARAQEAGMSCMILARAGELVEQNAETFWVAGVKNSIYSASCGVKSTHYPIIVGSEGTVARALHKELADVVPSILLIDECFAGATMINTAQGRLPISSLVGTRPEIYCMNEETGEIVLDRAVRVFSNGMRNISRIETTEGTIECTPTHKIYANGSWEEAKNLKHGRKITIDGSSDFVLKKLLRAAAAVARRLYLGITTKRQGR